MSQVQDAKDKNYWAVLDAVIRLEVTKGHLLWKVTDLSRVSGVGRPLIYYYFGKSKEEIVAAALKIIGDEFFGLSEARLALWSKGEVLTSVLKTRELLKAAPYVSVFFYHWRHQNHEISKELRRLEKALKQKISRLYPKRSEAEIEAFFTVLFGMILAPDISRESIELLLTKMAQ